MSINSEQARLINEVLSLVDRSPEVLRILMVFDDAVFVDQGEVMIAGERQDVDAMQAALVATAIAKQKNGVVGDE